MKNKRELFNYPYDNHHIKMILTQVIKMGEDIKNEDINYLDELIQVRARITTWKEYIIKMLENILKPSIVLSKASGELVNVYINNNNNVTLDQGRKEILHNITEILGIVTRLRENISGIYTYQQKGKDEIFNKLGISIPKTDKTLLFRIDYSNEVNWRSLNEIIQKPENNISELEIVNNKKLESVNIEEIMALVQENTNRTFMFIVDNITMNHPEKPILVVDIFSSPGQSFRVIASKLWLVENNLTIANLDFEDFMENVDKENIYWG